jgi:small subunit ribosomal protein S10
MKFRVSLRSFNNEIINIASKQFNTQLLSHNCQVTGIISLPTRIKKFCVLRSPHVNKDSREHFEIRMFKQFFDLKTDSPSILNFLLKLELPAGVSCSLKILNEKN